MPDAEAGDDLPDPEGMPDADPFGDGPADGPDGPAPDPTSGSGGTMDAVRSALRSTEPEVPLSDIDDPWNPEDGGRQRVYRGFQKLSGTDGMPAWYDLLIGALEIFAETYDETDEADDEPEGVV